MLCKVKLRDVNESGLLQEWVPIVTDYAIMTGDLRYQVDVFRTN